MAASLRLFLNARHASVVQWGVTSLRKVITRLFLIMLLQNQSASGSACSKKHRLMLCVVLCIVLVFKHVKHLKKWEHCLNTCTIKYNKDLRKYLSYIPSPGFSIRLLEFSECFRHPKWTDGASCIHQSGPDWGPGPMFPAVKGHTRQTVLH